MTEREEEIYSFIAKTGQASSQELCDAFGFGRSTSNEHCRRLRLQGLIHPSSHGRGAIWKLGPEDSIEPVQIQRVASVWDWAAGRTV